MASRVDRELIVHDHEAECVALPCLRCSAPPLLALTQAARPVLRMMRAPRGSGSSTVTAVRCCCRGGAYAALLVCVSTSTSARRDISRSLPSRAHREEEQN